MLEDMQHALNRIPPDLLGVLKTQGFNDMKESDTASGITSESEYLRPQLLDKGVQTSKSFTLIASEKLHKHIEESSVKIEAACTQMEAVCTKLKAEKLELESLLRSEKDLVCKLKEEMSSLEIMSRAKVLQMAFYDCHLIIICCLILFNLLLCSVLHLLSITGNLFWLIILSSLALYGNTFILL